MSAHPSAIAEALIEPVHTYRIGWWTHQWWPRREIVTCLIRGQQPDGRRVARVRYWRVIGHRFSLLRRPHRPWQAEYGGCRWCRRGWTEAGVRAKAQADRDHLLTTGEWSPWVQRKVARSTR